jgi:hypothetical protein
MIANGSIIEAVISLAILLTYGGARPKGQCGVSSFLTQKVIIVARITVDPSCVCLDPLGSSL